MKKYVTEMDWTVEVFDNKEEALSHIEFGWNELPNSQKEKAEYFRCYEIEVDADDDIDDIEDLSNVITEMLVDYINK